MNSTSINLSIITSLKGSVQKRIIADANGRPVKDGNHSLGISEGVGEDVTVDGLQELAALLSSLESNQALVLGQTGLGKQRIVPKDKLDGQPNTIARTKDYYNWPANYFLLPFDHDPEPGQPELSAEQFWSEMLQVFPEFAAVGRVTTVSTSSAIYSKATGKCLKPASGHHTYLVGRGDVERFKNLLPQRCWLHGKAFYKLANQNKQTGVPAILERFITDVAVFSPERLVYEAGACFEADSPFEQRLPEPQVFDGDYIDLDALPELTPDELAQAEANRKAARAKIEAQQLEQTCDRIRTEKPELGKREIKQVARQRIQSANQCLLEPDHMLYAMDGRCFKAGDIDSSYNGLKLKDPQEPSYRDGAQTAIIYASDNGWTIVSQAHGGCKYRLKHPVLGQSNKNLGRQIQRIYNRAAYRYWKRFGKLPDKPQPNPAQTNELYSREYIEQMSAAAAVEWEQQQQIEVGQAEENKAQFIGKLQSKKGKLRKEVKPNAAAAAVKAMATGQNDVHHVANQHEAIKKALALGKRVLVNVTMTGGGKNFEDSNLLADALSLLGVTKKISVLTDALNPSQTAYNKHYSRLDGRNLGTIVDPLSGKKRRADDETIAGKIEPSNCDFASVRNVNPQLACMVCRNSWRCGKESGDGYGARHQAHEAWRNPNLITSYGRLPYPDSDEAKNLGTAFLTLDEARERVEITRTIEVSRSQIFEKQRQLERDAPAIADLQKPLFDWLLNEEWKQDTAYNPKYGSSMLSLPIIPTDVDWDTLIKLESTEAQKQILTGSADKLSPSERNRLQRLENKQVPNTENERQWRRLEAKLEQAGKLNRNDRKALNLYRSTYLSQDEEYELANLRERHERTKFKSMSPTEFRNKSANLPNPWLVDFLSVAIADQRGLINFNPKGSLTITVANDHHRSAIADAKYVMLMGAYEARTNAEIAQRYGCHPNEVFIFDTRPEWQVKPDNLKIVQIASLGKMGRQRGQSFEDARLALNAELEQRNPDKHLNYDVKGQTRDKTHFVDNSSDNQPFEQRVTSILMTVPRPNMGAKLAEYRILTGNQVGFKDEGFQRFYQGEIRNLIMQTAGRFRAHWRPDEELTLYIISDEELPVEVDEILSASEIAPDAAVGREITFQLAEQAIANLAIEGCKLTQSAVAACIKALDSTIQCSQESLSKLFKLIPGGWKLLKSIYNAIFATGKAHKIKNITQAIESTSPGYKNDFAMEELDSVIQFFTKIVELYQQGMVTAPEVVKEVVNIALSLGSKVWRAVTASLPQELRSQLQSIVLEVYPKMPKWLGVPE